MVRQTNSERRSARTQHSPTATLQRARLVNARKVGCDMGRDVLSLMQKREGGNDDPIGHISHAARRPSRAHRPHCHQGSHDIPRAETPSPARSAPLVLKVGDAHHDKIIDTVNAHGKRSVCRSVGAAQVIFGRLGEPSAAPIPCYPCAHLVRR